MEGIIVPYKIERGYLDYLIYEDTIDCAISGLWFVKHEDWRFDIKAKINKLDSIINSTLEEIKDLDSEKTFTVIINEKKKLLQSLAVEYAKIVKNYMKSDGYYRSLINFYRNAYNNKTSFFDFSQKRKYIEISIHIQKLLKNEFLKFFSEYKKLRNTFIEINKYILNIKKMFDLD